MTPRRPRNPPGRGPSLALAVAVTVAGWFGLQLGQPTPASAVPSSTAPATPTAAPPQVAGPTAVDDVVALQASTVVSYTSFSYAKNDVVGGAALVRRLTTFPDDQPAGTTTSDDHTFASVGFGSISLDAAGAMRIVVAAKETGTASVRYRLVDANGASDEALITVAVGPGGGYAALTFVEGHEATSDVLAKNIAGRNADGTPGTIDTTSVHFTASSGGPSSTVSADGRTLVDPEKGVFRADPRTGVVTLDPVKTYRGGYEQHVSYDAQDTTRTADGAVEHHPYRLLIYLFVHAIDPKAVDDLGSTPFQTPLTLPGLTDDLAGDPAVPLSVARSAFLAPDAVGLASRSTLSADGHVLTVRAQGSWTIDDGGTITFDPVAGFSGWPTSATYVVRDVNGASAEGSEQVWVAPGPKAKPDVKTTVQDVDVKLGAAYNDVPGKNADGTPGSIDRASVIFPPTPQPAGSTVGAAGRTLVVPGQGVYTASRPNGVIRFDPDQQFVGTTRPVTYSVQDTVTRTDGRLKHNLATSTVTVSVTADRGGAPVASARTSPGGRP